MISYYNDNHLFNVILIIFVLYCIFNTTSVIAAEQQEVLTKKTMIIIEFVSKNVTENSPNIYQNIPLDITTPLVHATDNNNNIPDVYGALYYNNTTTTTITSSTEDNNSVNNDKVIWNVGTRDASGLRIRFQKSSNNNNNNNKVTLSGTGLFLFKVPNNLSVEDSNKHYIMTANIFTNRISNLHNATIRFVIGDSSSKQFYISESSPNFATTATTTTNNNSNNKDHQSNQFRLEISHNTKWYKYDPITSVQGVSIIGDYESFKNNTTLLQELKIQFVGFTLFATTTTTTATNNHNNENNAFAVNYGVQRFNVMLNDVSSNTTTTTISNNSSSICIMSGQQRNHRQQQQCNNDVVHANVTVDVTETYQIMDGFGGSAAWHVNTLLKRNDSDKIINLLFHDLQLDILRIRNVYQQNQQYMVNGIVTLIQKAKISLQDKPLQILISGWSPPARLKSNNETGNGGTIIKNIDGSYQYYNYATWWADSIDFYEDKGIIIDYVSIQNEPNYVDKWDTCRLEPNETDIYAGYNKAFEAVYKLVQTRRTSENKSLPKFIGPETPNFQRLSQYIQNLNNNDNTSNNKFYAYAHHYYQKDVGKYPDRLNNEMKTFRLQNNNKRLFMTEYSVLRNFTNTDIERKINLAKLIHNALTIEELSAYFYWALFWTQDQGIIVIQDDNTDMRITPEYYSFKHFSAFVHTGWIRVGTDTIINNNSNTGLSVSAFVNPNRDNLSIILINENEYSMVIDLTIPNFDVLQGSVYRSSKDEDCAYIGKFNATNALRFPPRSVITLSLERQQPASLTSSNDEEVNFTYCEICKMFRRNCGCSLSSSS